MALKFVDILYGHISLSGGEDVSLVTELIATPEVQRLRFLRLLNHDAPFMQELASARRFAHSIGTCYVAFHLVRRAPWISLQQRKHFLAAALMHDIGVLPYGHLIERELARLDSSFSHESLVRSIFWGTYHPTNIYHQILQNASLKVASTLRRFDVDPEEVFNLIRPPGGSLSPISGPIDIDNIDNVHRMAALMGFGGARKNIHCLLDLMSLDSNMHLLFEPASIHHIEQWSKYREMIYTHMIGHPACVAYNAFLQDIARKAVEHHVIDQSNWYLNDVDVESKLLASREVAGLSSQLRTGCRYRLIDYVWVEVDTTSSAHVSPALEGKLISALNVPPIKRAQYRIWVEQNKIRRALRLRVRGHKDFVNIGTPSTVVLVALIDPGTVSNDACQTFERQERVRWRLVVEREVGRILPGRVVTFCYPEEFPFGGKHFGSSQLKLFQTAT